MLEIFKTLKWDASCSIVEDMPTADVRENVYGEWLRHFDEDGDADGYSCPVCSEWYYFGNTTPNFCPNCGTVMSESLKWYEIGKSLVDGIQAGIKGEKDG